LVLLLFFLLAVVAPGLAQKPPTVELKPETRSAFQEFVREREAAIERGRIKGQRFLWLDEAGDGRLQRARKGEVVIEPVREKGVIEIKGGMVHDWIAAAHIPKVRLDAVLKTIQNYENHKNLFQPEVIDSKLLQRSGQDYSIHLRLLKKKIITVVLKTDHQVRYFPLDATRQHSRSWTTRIAEVDDAGTPGEKELPVGRDHGFLWNLNTYWRFQERDGGVYVECEAISLTRGIPLGLGWLVTPIVRELPRESLTQTMEATRRALAN
jgi:hypothetical protein